MNAQVKNRCAIDECEDERHARGWCNRHYLRWKRHGDPLHLEPPHLPPVMRGTDNPKWKGDKAGYAAVHHRIYRQLGAATDHTCPICAAPATDWAYDRADRAPRVDPLSGYRYSTRSIHYFPLCKPCHWRLDRLSLPMVAVTRAAEQVVIVPRLTGLVTA